MGNVEFIASVTDVEKVRGGYRATFMTPYGKMSKVAKGRDEVIELANRTIADFKHTESFRQTYPVAIEALMKVALEQDGSGATTAAQVLLSCYNSELHQLAVSDLCRLDNNNLRYAMCVLEGRVRLGELPSDVIPDGTQRFKDLMLMYKDLCANRRYSGWYEDDA